jgi:hypothetical protein
VGVSFFIISLNLLIVQNYLITLPTFVTIDTKKSGQICPLNIKL